MRARNRWIATLGGCILLAGAGTAAVHAEGAEGPSGGAVVTGEEPSFTVTLFVVRDDHGDVVSRGATATLGDTPAETVPTASFGPARQATARRGSQVQVRMLSPVGSQPLQATR